MSNNPEIKDAQNEIWVRWSEGTTLSADPKKVQEELDSLKTKGKLPDLDKIIEKARDPKTELHKCYEWNKDKAFETYLRSQTRYICNHLRVTYTNPETQKVELEVSYYTSVKTETGRRYVPTVDSMQQPQLKELVIAEAIQYFEKARDKLQMYNLLSRQNAEMVEKLIKGLREKMRRVSKK
jgi:hypothetical protein